MGETFEALVEAVDRRTVPEKMRLLEKLANDLLSSDGPALEVKNESKQIVGRFVPQPEVSQFSERTPERLEELRRRIENTDDWLTPEEFFGRLTGTEGSVPKSL